MYDEEGDDGPKSSFVTYLAEGDKLYNAGEYSKALDSYSTVSYDWKLEYYLPMICLQLYAVEVQ